jgi:hypothetical protein
MGKPDPWLEAGRGQANQELAKTARDTRRAAKESGKGPSVRYFPSVCSTTTHKQWTDRSKGKYRP